MKPAPQKDDYSWVVVACFAALALVVAVLGLTSFGVAAAATAALCFWFSGRDSWAVMILIATVPLIVVASINGDLVEFYSGLLGDYRSAIAAAHPIQSVASVWLAQGLDRKAWLVVGPMGAALGAAVTLILQDKRVSLLALATKSSTRRRRAAPLALLMRIWVDYHPAGSQGRTVLGTEFRTGKPVRISDTSLNRHSLIVGSVGRGKTVTTFNYLESAAQRGIPALYVDGKAQKELVPHFRELAERYGRKFYYWSASDIEASCAYNPLATGDFTSKADRIMALREWSEPHYESLAAGFIQTVFKVCERAGHPGGLLEIADVLSAKELLILLRRSGFSDAAKQKLADEVREQQEAERSGIGSLRRDIKNIAESSLSRLFDVKRAESEGRPVLTLARAREEKALVYVGLPGLLFPKTAPKVARLITSDLKATASSSDGLWLTVFEEFAAIAPTVLEILNLGRSFGLCGLLGCQSFSDLEACDPINPTVFARRILGSVNSYLVHALNDPEDAELAARLIGTEEQIEYTAQIADGEPTGAASARRVRSFRIHPDALKQIRTGEAVFLNKQDFSVHWLKVRNSGV